MTAKNTAKTAAPKTPKAAKGKAPKMGKVVKAAPKGGKKAADDGSLRGIPKPSNWVPETKKLSAAELKEKTGSPLRKPQARILSALSDAKGPLSRNKLTEATGIDNSWVGEWLGRSDPSKRNESETKWGYTSLLTLKFVTQKNLDIDGVSTLVYEMTAAGKKGLADFEKIQADKEAAKAEAEKAKADRAKAKAAKGKETAPVAKKTAAKKAKTAAKQSKAQKDAKADDSADLA